jgi:ABC-type Na+ efflux pump permease subunit
MLPGPIFRRELKAAAGRRGPFLLRTALATLLGVILLVSSPQVLGQGRLAGGLLDAAALRIWAGIVFAAAVGVEILFLCLICAAAVSPAIAEEREKDTLSLLLLTRLSRLDLLATKLAGRLTPSLLLLLTGLPLLVVSATWAGLPLHVTAQVLALAGTTLVVAGSFAILASSRSDRSGSASGRAISWTMLWLIGMPLVARLPVSRTALLGYLLDELRRLSAWIAPSSPVSLLTDTSWIFARGVGALSERLVKMLALQVVLIVLALAGAVASLRLREPHRNEWDAHGGYRPPVGDDPIFWREYSLPWRGSRRPAFVIMARQMLLLVKAILLMSLQLVFLALALGVAIGLVIGAGWFGYFAFRELWDQGSRVGAAYQARERLNLFIRGVVGMLGVLPLAGAPSAMTGRITIERDKKTWEPLLTTPLSGSEIVMAKIRATARGGWSFARWLLPLALLGIVCGALHPLGALIAAVELPLLGWAGLALGTWLAIRPGATTQGASSASAIWSLGLMLVGGLTVVLPLCSSRELARFMTWNAWLRWLLIGGLAALILVTAAFAWILLSRCLERFDEWVGRPHRASTATARAGIASGIRPATAVADVHGFPDAPPRPAAFS